MKPFLVRTFLGCCGLLLSCGLAHASTIFTLGNNPSGDVNILLNSGATGTTVQGTPSGFPQLTVNFTSSQVLLEPSSGQARISANPEGTPLTNLTISLANGGSYGDLIINPFIGGLCPLCILGGTATITVHAISSTGTPEPLVTFVYTLGNGNNFVTITESGGESIVSTSIVAQGGFSDLRQPRISGPFGVLTPASASVPEPASLFLLTFGLAGLAACRRRKTS